MKAPQDLIDEVNLTLTKHTSKDFSSPSDLPDLIGQCTMNLPKGHPINTIEWMLGGMFFAYVEKYDPISKIKALLAAREAAGIKNGERYNYCDMDLDIWAWHWTPDSPCLDCSSIVAFIDKNAPSKEDCTRCNGTGVEPEFKKEVWLIHHENHGNGFIFLATEKTSSFNLSIRALPGYLEKSQIKVLHKKLVAHINADTMRKRARKSGRLPAEECCLVLETRCGDDFLLDLRIDKPDSYDPRHECKVGPKPFHTMHALDTIISHFPTVQSDHEKGIE